MSARAMPLKCDFCTRKARATGELLENIHTHSCRMCLKHFVSVYKKALVRCETMLKMAEKADALRGHRD